ncbi:dihydrolipoamide acyltransferase [Ancylomarina euxinus]|uniref:Dihydrolipoamide acyltransferase n=1 Tax=Ancylomarina euxinus TaxID=2283627 RepID=A0A425Y464_9BACT|nr:thioesterase family protein [Ancylomarina euxinus]MCZ4694658.1 thioesterase family protein [Ancylomarina euxinus]MUP14203.1 dihydrolipoamide acyltransferase [Ancylomarina euxinus]RRG23054.1 dihydrolipoamide acyltransferase [Ancylomarina euxinus]
MSLDKGLSFTQEITVEENNTAIAHGSGKLPVFATPAMVAFMENTAVKCIENNLDKALDTVGIQIDTKHIKATKVGKKVTCTAKLTEVDGKKLTFEIEAADEDGPIGSSLHKRYVIDPIKFMERA